MRFKEYSTLTAWDGFDSLDEDSDDDAEREQLSAIPKSTDLGSELSSSPTAVTQVPSVITTSPRLPTFDASPIKSSSR